MSRTKIAKRQKHEKSKNRRKLTCSFSAVFTFFEGPPEWPQGICTLPFVLQPSATPIIKVFVNLSQKVAGCWGRAPTSFLLIIKLYLMFLHNRSTNQNLNEGRTGFALRYFIRFLVLRYCIPRRDDSRCACLHARSYQGRLPFEILLPR